MSKSFPIPWLQVPFDFRVNWVYDDELGWLEFCWLPSGYFGLTPGSTPVTLP